MGTGVGRHIAGRKRAGVEGRVVGTQPYRPNTRALAIYNRLVAALNIAERKVVKRPRHIGQLVGLGEYWLAWTLLRRLLHWG
jgi:hypothetical protein